MVEFPRYKIEQNYVMFLLSLVLTTAFISVIRGTRSSFSGFESVVHQYCEDNDQSFNKYLYMVLGSH